MGLTSAPLGVWAAFDRRVDFTRGGGGGGGGVLVVVGWCWWWGGEDYPLPP